MLVSDLLRDIDSGLPSNAILDSVYEVDDVLKALQTLDGKIDHLKGLKAYRVETINAEIAKLESRYESLRGIVLHTLKELEPNQKTFHFPDVGKVTRKVVSGTWVVEDELAAMDSLEKLGMKSRVVETKEAINKKELKKVVAELSEQNKTVAGTVYKEPGETISITFEIAPPKLSKKTAPTTQQSIDSLDALDGQV